MYHLMASPRAPGEQLLPSRASKHYQTLICLILCLAASAIVYTLPNDDNKHFSRKALVKVDKSLVLEEGTTECDLVSRSTLFSKKCGNRGRGVPRRLLVSGVGRSGTDHLTFVLNAAGFFVGHDNRDFKGDTRDGAVSWPHAFNDKICKHPGFSFRRRRLER